MLKIMLQGPSLGVCPSSPKENEKFSAFCIST